MLKFFTSLFRRHPQVEPPAPDGDYLICDVYRPAGYGDLTLRGVTAKADRVALYGYKGGFKGEDVRCLGYPALKLVDGVALPMDARDNPIGQYARSGNFIYSTDSRFPSKQPIPVGDRCMWRER